MGNAVRRVLMTADAVGGVWTYALQLAGGLADAGIAVDLAVMGPGPDPAQRRAASRVPSLRLHHAPFKLEWMEGAAADLAPGGAWLLEIARASRPDLVHLNGYAHAALPFGVPVLVVAHSCVRSWWRAVHAADPPPAWDGYARAVAAGLAAAAHVVAPTAAMLRALIACHGPLAAPASVIPNGALPLARPPAPKRPAVLAAGRVWDAGKNIAALVAAARDIPWPVWIAGDSAVGEGAAVDHPGVQGLGRLDAAGMADAYAAAAIYALPARYEPFGLSVLEAAQHGCALVLGDIDSLRESWDGAAMFVDPGDSQALSAVVRALAANPTALADLGARARERARRFPLSRTCAATLEIYRRLAGAPNAEETRACAS